MGNIPRAFNVVAKGDLTRMCSPGDIVVIQGVFLPLQYETWIGVLTTLHVAQNFDDLFI